MENTAWHFLAWQNRLVLVKGSISASLTPQSSELNLAFLWRLNSAISDMVPIRACTLPWHKLGLWSNGSYSSQLLFRLKPPSQQLKMWSLPCLNTSSAWPLEKEALTHLFFDHKCSKKCQLPFKDRGKRAQMPRHRCTKAELLQQRIICSAITFLHAAKQMHLQSPMHQQTPKTQRWQSPSRVGRGSLAPTGQFTFPHDAPQLVTIEVARFPSQWSTWALQHTSSLSEVSSPCPWLSSIGRRWSWTRSCWEGETTSIC